ncbi:hypothetical protein M0R45_025759 [Rubus argutus]|uniref:Protein kinase domain-containing protein n=1 Tax=Rubus argutus TaxID=59490 RepID=A0AAW1WZ66_RUBAR
MAWALLVSRESNSSNRDLSNNSFDVSDVPQWFSTLESLNTLVMDKTQLRGETCCSVQPSQLTDCVRGGEFNGTLILVQNPFCDKIGASQNRFNRTEVSSIASQLGTHIYQPPEYFEPFYFMGGNYQHFAEPNKSSNVGIIVGAAAGGSVLVLILLLVGVYAIRQKRRAKRATDQNYPLARLSCKWDVKKSSGRIPQLKGARSFSFKELMKYSNNFSEGNDVGSGSYGKVYRGTLPTGQLIAIKRAHKDSIQGGDEFKTEIELLSRVHHKNLVSLVGFCFDRGEQMLVYEYVANGTLRDSLSGKSGIRLDWKRRLKIALGAARGLAYLHELCNPPIIHRDIKSTNVLLDNSLTAKVSDLVSPSLWMRVDGIMSPLKLKGHWDTLILNIT